MTGARLPEDRYGSYARRRARPWVRWLLASATAVALALGTFVAYNNLGSQPITADQAAFRVLDDRSVLITIEVRRDEPQRPAACVVRARGGSGVEVGRGEVFIPPADGTKRYDSTLYTSERATTGEVYGCTYDVPEYLSSATRPTG